MFSSNRNHVAGPGVFVDLSRRRDERLRQGLPVIDLSIGNPDLSPPDHVRHALAHASLNPDLYGYAKAGRPGLRHAAADWYRFRFGVRLDPEREILSMRGAQDGLMHIGLALLNPGDTVLVPDPCYPAFTAGPALAGAKLHAMPLREENNYLIDFKSIPPAVARAARLMLVSYPNNPTTALAPDEFYEELIAFAHDNDIIVLHDNAYSEICFDGAQGRSFLEFEGAKSIGIEFNSLSKPFGLPGARIGLCLGNHDLCRRLKQLKSDIDYGMFLPVQAAAIAALTGSQDSVQHARAVYEARRNILCDGLRSCGWDVAPSAGTFFVWARLPEGHGDSFSFCEKLLAQTGILATPGRAFGKMGEGYVRLSLVRNEATLAQAAAAIGASGLIKAA